MEDNAAFDDITLSRGNYIVSQEYLPGIYLDEGYSEVGALRFDGDRGDYAPSNTHWAQNEKRNWPQQLQTAGCNQPPTKSAPRGRAQARARAPQAPQTVRRTREGYSVGIRYPNQDREAAEVMRAVDEDRRVPLGYNPNSGVEPGGANWARLLPGQGACVVPGECAGGYPARENWPASSKDWAKNFYPGNAGPPTWHSKSSFSAGGDSSSQLVQMLQMILLFILVVLMAFKLGFSIARHSASATQEAARYEAAVK